MVGAPLGRFLEELMRERGNILRALAKRRQVDLNDAQAVVEVFPKRAFVDHLAKVAVGRSHYAHVDGNHPRSAHALHLSRFENAQELRLKADVELADLVQEQGAAVGHFEAAAFAVGGTGERAAFVAEQNAFDEVRGDRAAVLNDEGTLRALGGAMNRPGDELLASAGFPAHEHGQIGRSHLLEHRENLAHAYPVSNEVVELLAPAEVDFDRAGRVLEADDRVPDPQGHARFEPCFFDADAGDPGAILRTEILKQEARLLGDDLAVRPAHAIVGELEVTDAAPADGHSLAGNVEPGAFLGPVFDYETALRKLAFGRFAFDDSGSQRGVVLHSASFRSALTAAA